MKFMSKFLRENPLVSQIDFGDNKIKRADMAVLMNVLSSNTNIEKVNLSKGNRKSVFMKVEDEGAILLNKRPAHTKMLKGVDSFSTLNYM